MIVCLCYGVNKSRLDSVVAEQCTQSVKDIQRKCKAGTDCGACLKELRKSIAEKKNA